MTNHPIVKPTREGEVISIWSVIGRNGWIGMPMMMRQSMTVCQREADRKPEERKTKSCQNNLGFFLLLQQHAEYQQKPSSTKGERERESARSFEKSPNIKRQLRFKIDFLSIPEKGRQNLLRSINEWERGREREREREREMCGVDGGKKTVSTCICSKQTRKEHMKQRKYVSDLNLSEWIWEKETT